MAEDPDDAGDASNISYLWQRQIDGNWSDLADAMARSYTIDGQVGDFYRAVISYVDGQGYQNSIASAPLPASVELVSDVLSEFQGLTITLVAEGLMLGFRRGTTEYVVWAGLRMS